MTARTPSSARTFGTSVGRSLVTTSMWVYALIAIAPLVLMLLNSLRTSQDLIQNPVALPKAPTFDAYVQAWTQASFGTYFGNSVLVTCGAVLLSTAVSLFAGYALARWKFLGGRVLENIFVSGLMIPVMLAVLPLFYLIDGFGLLDTHVALILIYAANGVPFSIFVLSAFYRQLPGELDEAAQLDGAGHIRTFLLIMLPLVRPAVATVVIFRFVPIWNDFLYPLVMLRSRENYTIPVGLTSFFGEFATDYAPLFAGLVIATVPLVLLFLVATKQIVAGLTAGIGK